MGFAFENFDVVGRWRDGWAGERAHCFSNTFKRKEIKDIIEFKSMLMERKELVVRNLAKKMLTYSTGRRLEAVDRGELDRITAELGKKDNRLRELIRLVVKSDIFLKN